MGNNTVRALTLVAFAITLTLGTSAKAESKLNWKVVLASGDDSIKTFDNARKKIKEILEKRGVDAKNIRELSVNPDEITGNVERTTPENIQRSLEKLGAKSGDACLVHVTSHGSKQGFTYIKPDSGLRPADLDKMLTDTCGDQPTVVLISACYSGVFVDELMQKSNRIVMTAARYDRPSFGCRSDHVYTYWDGCLIEALPTAKSWAEVYKNTTTCVTEKEKALSERNAKLTAEGRKLVDEAQGLAETAEAPDKLEEAKKIYIKGRQMLIEGQPIKPSYPQAFAGSQVKDLELP